MIKYETREAYLYAGREFASREDAQAFARSRGDEWPIIGYGYVTEPVTKPKGPK